MRTIMQVGIVVVLKYYYCSQSAPCSLRIFSSQIGIDFVFKLCCVFKLFFCFAGNLFLASWTRFRFHITLLWHNLLLRFHCDSLSRKSESLSISDSYLCLQYLTFPLRVSYSQAGIVFVFKFCFCFACAFVFTSKLSLANGNRCHFPNLISFRILIRFLSESLPDNSDSLSVSYHFAVSNVLPVSRRICSSQIRILSVFKLLCVSSFF